MQILRMQLLIMKHGIFAGNDLSESNPVFFFVEACLEGSQVLHKADIGWTSNRCHIHDVAISLKMRTGLVVYQSDNDRSLARLYAYCRGCVLST